METKSKVKSTFLFEERKKQIIEASVKLFISKGYYKTTTREICSSSGLSKGALYQYIKSKEDILYLVCVHIHDEAEQRLKNGLQELRTGAETLKQAIRTFFAVMDEMSDKVLLIYQELKYLPKAYIKSVLSREEQIAAIFEEILLQGIQDGSLHIDSHSVKLMANNIVVLGHMWVFRRWKLRKMFTAEEYAELQIKNILNIMGVGK